MEENATPSSIGQRIRAARKARRIKSTAELASLIPGGHLTGTVLRNIEAGVKPDLTVSELLNIAHALGIAPVFLLADLRTPSSTLDLPNLSDELTRMSALELDAWLSGNTDSAHSWASVDDQSERAQLHAMRELEHFASERRRLSRIIGIAPGVDGSSPLPAPSELLDSMRRRSEEAETQVRRLSDYLEAAGWDVKKWSAPSD